MSQLFLAHRRLRQPLQYLPPVTPSVFWPSAHCDLDLPAAGSRRFGRLRDRRTCPVRRLSGGRRAGGGTCEPAPSPRRRLVIRASHCAGQPAAVYRPVRLPCTSAPGRHPCASSVRASLRMCGHGCWRSWVTIHEKSEGGDTYAHMYIYNIHIASSEARETVKGARQLRKGGIRRATIDAGYG